VSTTSSKTAITAYPLQWPAGWKRTEPTWRVQAKFGKARRQEGYGENKRWIPSRDLTIAEGTDRVLAELKRMGLGRDDVVISTNLRLRLDGLPHSSQAEPADPGVAVYWQDSMQARKVMAIDLYDRVADNLAAVAATLEAMRAIERHGGAAILERAFTGFIALPAPIVAGMKREWWRVLDCSQHSSRETIEHSYRRLASRYHPDKENGDAAKMAELNAARVEALEAVQQ
jgi:DnaJ-like protein